jgi:putative ABC transport system permease protein
MNFLNLTLKGLFRRPAGLVASSLTVAIAGLVAALSFGLWGGYDVALKGDIDKMGANILAIPKGCPYEATGAILSGSAIGYSIDTSLMDRASQTEGIEKVSGIIMGQRPAGENKKVVVFYGIDENYFTLKPHLGLEDSIKSGEVILGYHSAETLEVSAGETLKVGTLEFTVSHVLEKFGSDDDVLVIIPIESAWEILRVDKKLSSILIKLNDPAEAEIVAKRLMDIPDLQVITMTDFYDTVSGFATGAKMAVTSVLAIIMLIAIIGVILAQVSSVSQRRGEIGMMRSMGANKFQMIYLSLCSAGFLGLIGGIIGVSAGYLLSPTIEKLIRTTLPQAPNASIIQLDFQTMATTVLIMVAVSILAGILPAIITAKIDPVEAING